MSDQSMELMHELLKQMNGTLSDLKDGQLLGNERLSAIEHHMAGFHSTTDTQRSELETLKKRIRRIESRLNLRDDHPKKP